MNFLNSFLPAIQHFGILGYWIILFISLAESLPLLGLIIPGSIIVGLFGFFSAQGYLDIGDLIWFSAIGAILGDGVSYYLGTKGVKFFLQENKILKLSHLEKGEDFFKKHGNKSIFLGRFTGPLRPIVPFIAGLSRMDKKAFWFWNIISGILWAISFLFLGYFFGDTVNTIEILSNRAGVFVFSIVAFLVIIRILIKYTSPFLAFLKSISLSVKEAVTANPDVKNFIEKHSDFFRFISRRLNKNRFSGLPLTLLSLAFAYTLFLFLGIIEDILTSDIIVAADMRVANLLLTFRDIELIKIFTWITLLGKWQIIVSLAVVTSFILWLWKKRIYILPLLLTVIGSELFVSLGKFAVHRPRPDAAWYAEDGFSFPSGHATIAVAFYGFLTYILFWHIKKWRYKINILFFSLTLILAIGLSRLYLDVHFLSDVWGGYLLGTLWLLTGIAISEWLRRRQLSLFTSTQKVKIATAVLIIAELVFYINFALNYNPPLAHKEIPDVIVITDALSIFQNNQASRFTETLIGEQQEPLSFIVIAKDAQQLADAMQKAGWYRADSANFSSVTKLAKSAILNENYPTAPMTPSFWNAKVHNLGFEKPTDTKTVRERHHVRFWQTQFKIDGNNIYVGTASQDIGVKWLVTHQIKPDIDTEREILFSDLKTTGAIADFQKEQFVEPTLGENFSGDQFFTDGKTYLIILK
jgi:undecaprenyl-diphosphatase